MKRLGNKILFLMMSIILVGVIQSLNIEFTNNIISFNNNLFIKNLYTPNALAFEIGDISYDLVGEEPAGEGTTTTTTTTAALPKQEGTLDEPIKLYLIKQNKVYSTTTADDYYKVMTLNECTEVMVYEIRKVSSGWGWFGSSNYWYKISDLADYWIKSSDAYQSTAVPNSCINGDEINIKTTTRPTPEFSVTATETPEDGYDAMYSNKLGSIQVNIKDIKYLRSGEYVNFTMKIINNGDDVTDKFNVSLPQPNSSGNVIFDINMKEETEYTKGDYSVEVYYETVKKNTKFTLIDKYYFLEIEITGPDSATYNNITSWQVNVTEYENVDLSKIEVVVERKNDDEYEESNNFEITQTEENDFIIQTKGELRADSVGEYRIVATYIDKNGNDSRDEPYSFEEAFQLTAPVVSSSRDNVLMYPYKYTSEEADFSIKINCIETYFDRKYINFTSNSINDVISFSIFRGNYASINFSDNSLQTDLAASSSITAYNFLYDNDGKILYPFTDSNGNVIYIYNVKWNIVSYYTVSGNTLNKQTIFRSSFESNYSGALSALDSDANFNTDSSGNITYSISGTTTLQKRELITNRNEAVSATLGGQIIIYTNLTGVTKSSFSDANIIIRDSNKRDVTNLPEFRDHKIEIYETKIIKEGGKKKGKYVEYVTQTKLTINYNGQDSTFNGSYYVTIEFDKVGNFKLSYEETFDIREGVIDYYARAQRELTDGIEKTIPSNSKVEWLVGIYLYDGTNNRIKRNEKNFQVHIFDKRVELDSNGNMQFYDLINYQIVVTNKLGDNITYTVIENGENKGEKTESYASFKNKYADAANQIDKDMISFDSSSGNVTSTNYATWNSSSTSDTIKVYRIYFDEETGTRKIDYSLNGQSQTTSDYNTIVDTYDKFALFFTYSLVMDTDGYVVGGQVRGSYHDPVSEREDISDLFTITYNKYDETLGVDNELKAISITPKTEVDPGEYYVYLGYNEKRGIGDINNDPDNIIFGWNEYPEFWEQNIHMVIIDYVDPEYAFEILPPTLSSDFGNSNEICNNVKGEAKLSINFQNTYDFEKTVSTKVYTCTAGEVCGTEDDDKSTWTDVTDKFDFENDFKELTDGSSNSTQKFGYINVKTKDSTNENGIYIVEVTYQKNSADKSKVYISSAMTKFEISKTCKNAIPKITGDKSEIYGYFNDNLSVRVRGQFIGNNATLIPVIENEEGVTYTGDIVSKQIKDNDGQVYFTYDYQVSAGENSNEDNYDFVIKNVADRVAAGTYNLYFLYESNGIYASTSKVEFKVLHTESRVDMSAPENDNISFDDSEITIKKSVTAVFISDENLDNISFILKQWKTRDYYDVSSPTASDKQAVVSVKWDDSTKTDTTINGVLTIKLDRSKADLNAEAEDYRVDAIYNDEIIGAMTIPALKDLMTWEADPNNLNIFVLYDGYEEELNSGTFAENMDVRIEMNVNTAFSTNMNWAIVSSDACYNEYRGSGNACDVNVNYNSYFTANNTTGTDGKLILTYQPTSIRLKTGVYFLALWYADTPNERALVPIIIQDKIITIEFDQNLIYSESGDTTIDGLFQNKVGYIYLPVLIYGISPNETIVEFTDSSGNSLTTQPFTYDENMYLQRGILDIQYNPSHIVADANDYMIIVKASSNTSVYESLTFTMNATFFNYWISDPIYNPSTGLIPNSETGGEVTFRITTEGLSGIYDMRNKLPNNTHIYNSEGTEVTDKFNISANVVSDSTTNIDLVISYTKDSGISPDTYRVETYHTSGGHTVTKSTNIVVGNYNKTFTLNDNIEIFSNTNDNKIHKNVSGTFRIGYTTPYDLSTGRMYIIVRNSANNDVTDRFSYQITSSYIDLTYKASPELDSADYTITVYYEEDGNTNSVSKTITIDPNFNTILISDMTAHPISGMTSIYADRDGQSYTFNVNTAGIKLATYTLEAEILDSNKNDVTSNFSVTKSGDTFTIGINAFKADIGTYQIRLYVLDEKSQKNYSNTLEFKIDEKFYNLKIENYSINQIRSYNNDTTSIYDKDGAHVIYSYSTNYTGTKQISVILMQDDNKIKEFTDYTDNNFEFNTGTLTKGKYKLAISIDGVVYDYKEFNAIEYIEITDIILTIGGKDITTTSFTQSIGSTYITLRVEPSNATANVITVRSSDTTILNANLSRMIISKEGTADLIVSTLAMEKTYTITAKQLISSAKYDINHTSKSINVNSMNTNKLTYASFISNITGLQTGYKVTNASDATITSGNIGTGYKIVTGGSTYTITVIGDITGDGTINALDVAWLYQNVRNKRTFNANQTKAGLIRKSTSINAVDVAWLYAFVRGTRPSI